MSVITVCMPHCRFLQFSRAELSCNEANDFVSGKVLDFGVEFLLKSTCRVVEDYQTVELLECLGV